MATSVGLNFRLTAAVENFEKSMSEVNKKLGQIDKSSRQTANGMKLLAAIEIGRTVLNGLTGLFNIFKGGIDTVSAFSSQAAAAADAIGKLSSSTGMAEEPLQVFTQLAGYGGVSATQFGDAVQKMSRGLGEAANGTGTAGRALEQMGLSIDNLLSMSPDEQFLRIGAAIGEIEDPAKRSQVAADIFGRSGTKLIPMFEDLEVNAKATAEEMLELGQVLSGTQVDNIEAMNDSFEKVRQTAFKIGSQVLANFAPALEDANNSLIEMIKSFEYEGTKGGQGLANFLTKQFFEFAKTLAQVFDKFVTAFSDALGLMMKGFGTIVTDFGTVIASLMGADAETLQDIEWAGRMMKSFGNQVSKTETNMAGLVDNALEAFNASSNEAAESLASLGLATTDTKTAAEQFGKENGIAGEALRQLALDAENYGENAEFARQALDGMKDAAKDATPAADLFGRNVGTSAEQLAKLARDQENYADNLRRAEDALDGLADSGVISHKQLEDLAGIVAESGGIHSDLGKKLLAVADSAGKLDDVQRSLQQSMMKPAQDFANQRAEMLKRMGFNPFFVEAQKEKWLAQQQDAVDKQIEIQRKAYESFLEKTGEGAGTAIKEALESTLDLDTEDTLPELQAQTSTLGQILEAVKQQVLQPVTI